MFILYSRAELQTARELGEQLLHPGPKRPGPSSPLEAHQALGDLVQLGEFVPARDHLEQGIALYDPQHIAPTPSQLARPGVVCLSYGSFRPVDAWLSGPGSEEKP